MSDPGAGAIPEPPAPEPNLWTSVPPPVRHSYGLTVRNHGLMTAFGLLIRTMPYAFARFGILLAYSVACIIWIVVAFGGAAWLGTHIAGAFGVVWFVLCVVGVGWFWGTVLRYALHLLACGHVAVLTELIVRGQVGNGSESMLSYGKRVVAGALRRGEHPVRHEHAGARHPQHLPSHPGLDRPDDPDPRVWRACPASSR